MKFQETHFEDYIQSSEVNNLHPKIEILSKLFPDSIDNLRNCLFYGPEGVGKYSQVLKIIKKYSNSGLKYEKKISITFNKIQYFFKISDIHIEIDMQLLGCNSKLFWNTIYNQIVDVAASKMNNTHIIVCKNFQDIHSELLDDFYSYMQTTQYNSIKLIYFIVSDNISFIPDNIINITRLIPIQRMNKSKIAQCFNNKVKNKVGEISNLKNIRSNITQLTNPHFIICDRIISIILDIENLNFLSIRENLYDIFIYNLNLYECIWYIITSLINDKYIKEPLVSDLLVKTFSFLKYYNNNYRPIYHLENYVFYLIKKIHEL